MDHRQSSITQTEVDQVSINNEPSEMTINNMMKFFGFSAFLIVLFVLIMLIINPFLLIFYYKNQQGTLTTDENMYVNIAIASIVFLFTPFIISFFLYLTKIKSFNPYKNRLFMVCIFIYAILTIIVCEKLRNLDNTNDQSYKVFPIIFYIILGIYCLFLLYTFVSGRKHSKIAAEESGPSVISLENNNKQT